MSRIMDEVREEAAAWAEHKKAVNIALNMLADNVPLEKIVLYSGLSPEEVQKLADRRSA